MVILYNLTTMTTSNHVHLLSSVSIDVKQAVNSSKLSYSIVKEYYQGCDQEMFSILVLSYSLHPIGWELISIGGTSQCIVDTKIVFRKALSYPRVSKIILYHNHPSGSLIPSLQDEKLTKELVSAGNILQLPVLDHLIVTDDGYTSLRDHDDSLFN
jgi:DNA repair protein RadC